MTLSEWWRGLHGFVKFIIPFLAVIAASSAAMTAWVTMGWPIPATREYVNIEVGRIAASVLGLAREQRDRLRRSRDVLVMRLAAAKDPIARGDLKQLMDQADEDIAEVDKRITVLERLRRD